MVEMQGKKYEAIADALKDDDRRFTCMSMQQIAEIIGLSPHHDDIDPSSIVVDTK
jgi:hypothetical protein